jgi:hypothetical protein
MHYLAPILLALILNTVGKGDGSYDSTEIISIHNTAFIAGTVCTIYMYAVVGKVTVTPLQSYITSYFLE